MSEREENVRFEVVVKLTGYATSQGKMMAEIERRLTHPDGVRNDPFMLNVEETTAKRKSL